MGCSATTASRKMIVSAARRMVRAISFGVFCRSAPSTRAIIRSTNDSPGAAVICTTMRSDSTVVPPVTELRSPPDSRITGADSPVIADSSTVAMPSTMSPSPGMTCPASTTTRSPTFSVGAGDLLLGAVGAQPAGDGLGPGPAQALGLRLPAALGDGLGEVGEQDGEPQPDGDQPGEDARVEDRRPGHQDRAEPDDEHDRVAELDARVELAQRVGQRAPQLAGGERAGAHGASGPFGVLVLAVEVDRSGGTS